MRRFHSPFNGKRFIGDKRKKVVHDCFFESWAAGAKGCQIDDILPEDTRTFDPDSATEAIRKGFVRCTKCQLTEQRIHE